MFKQIYWLGCAQLLLLSLAVAATSSQDDYPKASANPTTKATTTITTTTAAAAESTTTWQHRKHGQAYALGTHKAPTTMPPPTHNKNHHRNHHQTAHAQAATQQQRTLHSPTSQRPQQEQQLTSSGSSIMAASGMATTSKPHASVGSKAGGGWQRLTLKTANKLDSDDEIYDYDANDNDADDDNYGYDDDDDDAALSSAIDFDYAPRHNHGHNQRAYVPKPTQPPPLPPRPIQTQPQRPKRVPRDHQHQWQHHGHNNNRLDAHAATFDEDYPADQPGVLTAQKVQELGTVENAQRAHRRYQEIQNQSILRQMAVTHRQRIEMEARCMWPQPRVIYITNETSKVYSPRATVLHRCDESTGCCANILETCTVKTMEYVDLAFWESSYLRNRNQMRPVLLPMLNHTECHCVNLNAERRKRSFQALAASSALSSQCQCPRHFASFSWESSGVAASTHCRCDCHLSDLTCQRLKNGDEGFAVSDRRCISSGDCSPPICTYGFYSQHSGRCPRSDQQQSDYSGQGSQRIHHGFG